MVLAEGCPLRYCFICATTMYESFYELRDHEDRARKCD